MPIDIKSWAVAETVTGVKLNAHLSDKLTLLLNKNIAVRDIVELATTEVGRIANEVVPFDKAVRLAHTMSKNGTILVRVDFPTRTRRLTGTNTNYNGKIDIKVDDDWFLSSGTTVALSEGLLHYAASANNTPTNLSGHFIRDNMEEGIHTYELYAAADNGDNSMEIAVGGQWSIEEHTDNLADFLLLGEPL